MIHYTPYPAEWLFDDYTQVPTRYTIDWEGVPMIIEWDEQYGATIVQLLSCDPQHYLNPRFQPGSKVEFILS